ncbi:MAG TPA: hypothetical protein VKS22_16430 [Candidatus Binataceae bacterium]|nr:hypothetical protein [Candidatus Binataceae bacterium]
MATVRGVVNFRVKPGRYADLYEGLKAVKKLIEGLGAAFVVSRQVIGSESGNVIVVAVYKDYAGYAKVASDAAFSELINTMINNPNPAWEGYTVSLNEEVAL